MCIIILKREELKQPQNSLGCKNPQSQAKNNRNMVTPPKSHPGSKSGQFGGAGGNKKPHNPSSHHIKRSQNNKAPTTPAMHLHTSTVSQQKGKQTHHHKSNQINHSNNSQQSNRHSPNPNNVNSFSVNNQHNRSQQQQRYSNRQTPPRNVTTHQVNMNNGQPSLEIMTNPAQKNEVAQHKHSQKSSSPDTSVRTQKGHTVTDVSRSSPISTNLSKSNRSSPQCFAGSKCFEPPTPNSLPKPPSDWTPFSFPSKQNLFGNVCHALTFNDIAETNGLKNHFSVSPVRDVSHELQLILNVSA